MYHIKSDKRSQLSAAEMVRGLQRCLETTPLHSITVSDLHRETGISRATFYRLFDTPEDVLIYQMDQMMEQTTSLCEENSQLPPVKVFERMVYQGLESHALLEALVENGRIDILYSYTEKRFRVFDQIFSVFPENMTPVEAEYLLSNLSMNMVSTLITWVKRGRVDSAEEIMRYTRQYWRMLAQLGEDTAEQGRG